MRRRDFVTLLGSIAAAWPRAVRAQQGYQRFVPLLIDLPGWTGMQPAGMEKETKGDRVTTASRSYTRGEARLVVGLISGTDALAASTIITTSAHISSTSTINGFQVRTLSTPVFVLIAITLSSNATLTFFFNGVSEDNTMAIAQAFDWKRFQALLY
jgi:hypothetical protein